MSIDYAKKTPILHVVEFCWFDCIGQMLHMTSLEGHESPIFWSFGLIPVVSSHFWRWGGHGDDVAVVNS